MPASVHALPDVTIVGGTTLLGGELKECLAARTDFGEVRLLSVREPEEPGLHAQLTDFGGEAVVEATINAEDVASAALVFVCDRVAAGHPSLRAARLLVDLSGAPAAEGSAVVAGVNDAQLSCGTRFRSPHAAVILLGHVLSALKPLLPFQASATVLLGAAEEGRPGIDELMAQTRAALTFSTVPAAVFPQQLAFNLLPPFFPSPDAEPPEKAIVRDLADVLGEPAAVAVVRVPVFYGIGSCIHLALPASVDGAAARARAALAASPSIEVREASQATPVGIVGEDRVVVGTVAEVPGGVFIWALCDNARRGGALNAIEMAASLLAAH